MKKTNILFIAAVGALIIAIISVVLIYRSHNIQTSECSLYFLNQTGTSLTVEDRNISYRYDEDLPAAVLKQLIKGPENSRNLRVINRHVNINAISNDGTGNYIVDFSGDFYTEDRYRTIFSVYAVVKTLCLIDGVNSVKVTVEGEDFVSSDGNIIGALTSDDINLSIDTDSSETHTVRLYFADSETNKLAAEERTIRITDQQPLQQYIIHELIKGPKDRNHSAVLSSGTTLISVTISDNIGFVNFAKNFVDKNTSSPEKEEQAIFSIVNSMTELEGISRVQFLVEGKKVEKFGEISIEHPIGRNDDIIISQ